MKEDRFDKILTFLHRLDEAKIHYSLGHYRDDGISVKIVVPGERWEVDFLDDGDVDVERFVSNGEIYEESMLEELFAKYSDAEPPTEEAVPQDDALAQK
jgi:hypothetical protein